MKNLLEFIKDTAGFGNPICPPLSDWAASHTIFIQGPKEKEPKPFSIAKFEETTNIHYFPSLGFLNNKTEHLVQKQCQIAINSGKLNKEVKWMGALFKKELEIGYINDVIIKWVDHKIGFGLFAARTLKKGEFIGSYTGMVRRYIPFWTTINPYCYRYPSSPFGWRTFTIDASTHGNEIRYINHSDTPNCRSIVALHNGLFYMCIQAEQEIQPGEELFYDYGHNYKYS